MTMNPLMRRFGLSAVLTILAVVFVFDILGPSATVIFLLLAAIELAFSFDNAVINAKVLGDMSKLWQKIFLSVGIVIAIFGVRLLLPLYVVRWTARIPLADVADLALHHPALYAEKLAAAHATITAFGGAFLLMLTLHFFMS